MGIFPTWPITKSKSKPIQPRNSNLNHIQSPYLKKKITIKKESLPDYIPACMWFRQKKKKKAKNKIEKEERNISVTFNPIVLYNLKR